jgi:predicted naringenin-chalcone synthase
MAGYTSPRIVNIFRNRDIDFRHFYVEPGQIRQETSGDLNNRYGRGAMETGCRAVASCLQAAKTKVTDIDFFVVCTSTGYVCPDIGSRLTAYVG